jgi:hypothetical protein
LPAPKANFVRVVINGEDWGIYVNVQQFNKDFLQENFRTEKGARWKVKGSPMGGGGLEYLGDDVAEYRRHYDLKTEDDADDWKALIELCRVLKQTPPEKLEEALAPIADVDNLLWFLALDCALINSDGYWVRASDYSLYRDKFGKFHFIPHDMNEAFRRPEGPGMGRPGGRNAAGPQANRGNADDARRAGPGGAFDSNVPPPRGLERPATDGRDRNALPPGAGRDESPEFRRRDESNVARGERAEAPGGPGERPSRERGGFGPGGFPSMPAVKGVELDPLIALDDEKKPLRSKVLAVPSLRARYLAKVRLIAEEWLDWKNLGPMVGRYRKLIEPVVAEETRGLSTYAAFQKATADDAPGNEGQPEGRGHEMSLREFADQRRAYLLNHPEIQKLAK